MNTGNRSNNDTGSLTQRRNKDVDADLLAFISSLIDQNSKLQKELYELECQKEILDKVLDEAHKMAEEIIRKAKTEAQKRSAEIISESQAKAKLEADKIVAEAEQKAQDVAKEHIQAAIYQGSQIIDKAQERYQLIVEEAKQKAEGISKKISRKLKK